MQLLMESQTGKSAYYDDYGNRYLFSKKQYRHYIIIKTIKWLLNYCN